MPDGCYQIISGHRRKFAAVKLRYRKVPVIIRALNDDEALVAMVDSNLQREKIRVSEKAFAYSGKKALSVNSESSDPEQAVSPGMAEEAADTNTNDETSADAALLMKLLQKPEMAALLKMLAASL